MLCFAPARLSRSSLYAPPMLKMVAGSGLALCRWFLLVQLLATLLGKLACFVRRYSRKVSVQPRQVQLWIHPLKLPRNRPWVQLGCPASRCVFDSASPLRLHLFSHILILSPPISPQPIILSISCRLPSFVLSLLFI